MSAAALNMVSFCKGRNIDVVRLTVLCSSPSLTWNVCSKMVYMILPMPNEGSITLGTTSSTVDERHYKTTCSGIISPHVSLE